jgi:chemotaxis protein CheC
MQKIRIPEATPTPAVMRSLSPARLDALKEVANIGAGHAARLVSVMMEMHGSLNGQTLLALPLITGHRLVDLLLRRERRRADTGFDRLEESALKEAGNILGGAYMTALSEFLEMRLMPSPPRLRIATASEILEDCNSLLVGDCAVYCVETEFSFEEVGERFRGFFLLLPDPDSFSAIFRAVRLS